MILIETLKKILDSKGFVYNQDENRISLVFGHDTRKWCVVLEADEESFLRYYARYPWQVPENRTDVLLKELNRLNRFQRAGCFLLDKGYPVFRYGVYIFDAFTAAETITDLILTSAAATNAAWNDIYGALVSFGSAQTSR